MKIKLRCILIQIKGQYQKSQRVCRIKTRRIKDGDGRKKNKKKVLLRWAPLLYIRLFRAEVVAGKACWQPGQSSSACGRRSCHNLQPPDINQNSCLRVDIENLKGQERRKRQKTVPVRWSRPTPSVFLTSTALNSTGAPYARVEFPNLVLVRPSVDYKSLSITHRSMKLKNTHPLAKCPLGNTRTNTDVNQFSISLLLKYFTE